MKRLAILTSGGDAPGMNAAIRAATLLAIARKVEVFGVIQGYVGLISGDIRPLDAAMVATLVREGGTMLGSARSREFMERAGRDRARAALLAHGIDGLLVIGGNGSLTGMRALIDPAEGGGAVRAIGVPASIDNDLGCTKLAIGVDTAMNTIVDACDKISDTASAHDRTFIVEVMGRDCGYLAMTAAIASAAEVVLFPESERSEEQIADTVVRAVEKARLRPNRSKRVLVIKAEGVGVSAERLKTLVDQRLGSAVETRVTVLGHVVRGGRPSALDRILASRLAHVAVRGLLAGKTRKMAAWMAPREVGAEVSESDPQCALVDIDVMLDETRKMLEHSSPFVKWRQNVFAELEDVFVL